MIANKHFRLSLLLPWIFCALWFAACHLWHTADVWRDPTMRIPGPIGDNCVMLWNLGWVSHALNHGHPGFWCPAAYYPDGFLFLYGTHTWLDGVLGWLAAPVLPGGIRGHIFWANIVMLLSTVTTGLFCIGALRYWGVRRWAVLLLVASGITFCWFRVFARTGHYHFHGTQWMLLALLLLSRARAFSLEGNAAIARRSLTLAGLALGVTFLNDQTMAVFAGILGGLILLTIPASRSALRDLPGRIARFYGWALLPASIHLIPILVAVADGSLKYEVKTEHARLVDATSLVFPNSMHRSNMWIEDLRQAHGLGWAEGTYLGIVPLLLLALLLCYAARYAFSSPGHRPRHLRPVFLAALAACGFLVLALGDTLMIGQHTYWALPGRLLKSIPVLNNIRLPQRWVWPAHLCIGLGAALCLTQMLANTTPRRGRVIMALCGLTALVPPLEGRVYKLAKSHEDEWARLRMPPNDYRNDDFINPPGMADSVRAHYAGGGVLAMPVQLAYAHANVFQFLWGYDIPVSVAYTARMPFSIEKMPWHLEQWNEEAGEWLQDRDVRMIVFPFHSGKADEFQPWLRQARRVVPELVVLDRFGKELPAL